jgi:hypothetical protein
MTKIDRIPVSIRSEIDPPISLTRQRLKSLFSIPYSLFPIPYSLSPPINLMRVQLLML